MWLVTNKFIYNIQSQFNIKFLNVRRFELFSIIKHLVKLYLTTRLRDNSKGFKDLIMFVRAAALVFLFLIRLRYPHSKSVTRLPEKGMNRTQLSGLEN